MFTYTWALVFALLPVTPVVEDAADVIEINRYYSQDGEMVFRQVIFWQWHREEGRYHVFAWRMLKSPELMPVWDQRRGEYTLRFLDDGVMRRVRAPSLRESWTQYDPELLDRQSLPQAARRGLAHDSRRRATASRRRSP